MKQAKYGNQVSRPATDQKFIAKSLRHLSEMQRNAPANGASGQPCPEGWFDFSPGALADLGAFYYLASLTPYHRPRTLAQSLAGFEPAWRLGQYRVFRSGGHPRAFVTWAGLNREAELSYGAHHLPLRPEQWNSGASKWVIDLVAPFGHIEQILGFLSKSANTNRVRTLWHNASGTKARVIEWSRWSKDDEIFVRSYGPRQFERMMLEG